MFEILTLVAFAAGIVVLCCLLCLFGSALRLAFKVVWWPVKIVLALVAALVLLAVVLPLAVVLGPVVLVVAIVAIPLLVIGAILLGGLFGLGLLA